MVSEKAPTMFSMWVKLSIERVSPLCSLNH